MHLALFLVIAINHHVSLMVFLIFYHLQNFCDHRSFFTAGLTARRNPQHMCMLTNGAWTLYIVFGDSYIL